MESARACEDLKLTHDTATPNRSEKHMEELTGLSPEVREGTTVTLVQCDLSEGWWRGDSMDCFWYRHNEHGSSAEGKTPYQKRFGSPIRGNVIPLGPPTNPSPKKTSVVSNSAWSKHAFMYLEKTRVACAE